MPATKDETANLANARVHEGKLAIVTGGSRSVGEYITRNLASKGANVCMIYKTESSDPLAAQVAKEVTEQHGIKAVPIRADMTTLEGIAHIIDTCRKSFPDNHRKRQPIIVNGALAPGSSNEEVTDLQVDILVNCAALFHSVPLTETKIEDFHAVYSTNVLAPILLTQAVVPLLPTDRSGRVINISSVGSRLGHPGLTLYGGTKGALEAMTRIWSRELAERATVNCLSLGSVWTDMFRNAPKPVLDFQALFGPLTPLSGVREWDDGEVRAKAPETKGRVAYPEEIASLVAMVCSADSGWMTGSIICANGGQFFSY